MNEIPVHRLEGTQSFAQAVDEVDRILHEALASGIRRILIDVRGLTGFDKPSVAARVGMVRRWAQTTQGRVKMAMISRAEINDDERFDVVLARSLGFDGDVFETEDEGRHWLEQPAAR